MIEYVNFKVGKTRHRRDESSCFLSYIFSLCWRHKYYTHARPRQKMFLYWYIIHKEKERERKRGKGGKEKKNKFHNGVLINTYNSNVLHALTGKPIERECVCCVWWFKKRCKSLCVCVYYTMGTRGEYKKREGENVSIGATRQTVERTRRSEGSYDDDERILIKLFLLQHAAQLV